MLKPLGQLKPICIEWDDIFDDGSDWAGHDETAKVKPVRVKTVGYLLSENKKHIVLVRDYYDHDGKRTYGGRLAIPVGCIVRRTALGVQK